MSNEPFDFNSFVKESKEVFINPKSYFGTLKIYGGFTEPLIKAVIYGAVAGLFSFLWSILNLSPVATGIIGGAVGIMAFIWSVIGSVIALFIGAVVILIISSICKGSSDFEACLRVSAVLLIIIPVNSLLGFVTALSLSLGMIVSFVVSLYGLYLLYIALIKVLKTNQQTTRTVSYILIALLVLFMLAATASRRAANRYLQDFNSRSQELFNN